MQDKTTEQLLVLKAPSIDLAEQPDYLERLMREEWIAKRVTSNHVVRTASINRPRTALYTLFEYVEGQTLKQWQLDHPTPTLEQVRSIIEQLVWGYYPSQSSHNEMRCDKKNPSPEEDSTMPNAPAGIRLEG